MRPSIRNTAIALIVCLCLFQCNIILGVENGPEDVVKNYYTADFNGARLTGEKYKRIISPLITWVNEPGWDLIFVTRKIILGKVEKLGGKEISIEVRYENVGILNGDNLIEIDFTDVINFVVRDEAGGWKIKKPIFVPHVSAAALRAHLEKLRSDVKDKNRSEKLKTIINILKDM